MMKKGFSRVLSLTLVSGFILSALFACSSQATSPQTITTAAETDVTETIEAETEYVDHRFDGVDFDGREFRIQTSTDTTDASNANDLIEGSGEQNGDVVNDAVYDRNLKVEELLNIKLVFTESSYTYSTAESNIRKLVMAGDDVYDVIINDVRSLIALTDENILANVYDMDNFDMTQTYWYSDAMEDLTLLPDHMYVMAGDYFTDVIMSCHALFYNKNLCEAYFDDPEYIYNLVTDGKWTYEKVTEIVNATYSDLNGDGVANEGDQFGMAAYGTWGSLIPFIGSAGIQFIDRSSGTPEFCFNNERSVAYIEALNTLYWSDGVINDIVDHTDFNLGLRNLFGASQALIVCYQRLNDLSKMRDFDFDIGVIPYPKLTEEDKYYTSIHDTTEMGAIPITATDMDFITTALEVLNRETSKTVMTEYYDVALKVKYSTDKKSAEMIDLIHDSFGSCFPLAYDMSLNEIMLHSFADPVAKKSADFASTYDSKISSAESKLAAMIEGVEANS